VFQTVQPYQRSGTVQISSTFGSNISGGVQFWSSRTKTKRYTIRNGIPTW